MKTKVTFDYEVQTASGKINRNDAAQISLFLLGGVGSCIVNNAFDLADLMPCPAFREPINENESSNTEYYLNISGGARVLITRKYINFNNK